MTVPLKINVLPEPKVQFSDGKTDVDPRRGLEKFKPADYLGERKITLGVVGLKDDTEAAAGWLGRFSRFSPGQEKNSKRYRDWPGLNTALGAEFRLPKRLQRVVNQGQYSLAMKRAKIGDGLQDLVDLYADKVASLLDDDGPDCIIVCIPSELGDLRASNPSLNAEERRALEIIQREEISDQLALFQPTAEELKAARALYSLAEDLLFRTFYRALKAKVMSLPNAVPIQVLRRDTIERPDSSGQSHATRMWNIATSIYYKAKGIPWRPAELPRNVCFVGITFHHMKRRGGHLVYASVAQAYSTELDPFALKGANIDHDQKKDRQTYLNSAQAKDLLRKVIDAYEERAGVLPDRVVIHKTTRYMEEEEQGFSEAVEGVVPKLDLIWIRPTSFRVVRKGQEEPWRGTVCSLDDKNYLFTSGYVPWWNEYPGAHIPAPLEIGSAFETDILARAKEILALTKMNWNSSDGVGSYPITLLFAKRVGELMCEFGKDDSPNPSYRFYV